MNLMVIVGSIVLLVACIYFVVGKMLNTNNKETNELKESAKKVAEALEQEAIAVIKPIAKNITTEVKTKLEEVVKAKTSELEKEILNSIDQIANNVITKKLPTKKQE